jgi:hypothetical protein
MPGRANLLGGKREQTGKEEKFFFIPNIQLSVYCQNTVFGLYFTFQKKCSSLLNLRKWLGYNGEFRHLDGIR